MNDILSSIKDYFQLLIEPSIALLIGILTIVVTKDSNKFEAARERLINAYHPIFLAAEPYLFKKINTEAAKLFIARFNEIELEHSLFIYPSLRHWVCLLSAALTSDCSQSQLDVYWTNICRYINSDYDNLCKKTHMPIRSTAYRLNKSQFSSKPALYWGTFKLLFFPMITFVVMILVFLFIMGYINSLLK